MFARNRADRTMATALPTSQPVFRFAPSPNGRLHLGHALSAVTNRDMAARMEGRLLLRLEDIDTARCTPALEAALLVDLRRLGFSWEEPVRRQSEHFDAYAARLDELVRDGLAYPAFMSRGEIRAHIAEHEAGGGRWPRDPDGAPLYPGLDRAMPERRRRARIAAGEPFAWRLDSAAAVDAAGPTLDWTEIADAGRPEVTATVEADPLAWGDVVLARRDVPTSYHLSVVVDDALQGVTHVVRGADLREATAVHRLLQRLLGLPAPIYHHHRLVLGPDGRKLSKSEGSAALVSLFEQGARIDDIRARLGLPAGPA
jgi:glutamyl-Q tRNA(Asp) synthetase